ncbi:methionyl-tRNA formyltransferase [Taibaiella helva]|uniref:methionyl-tRNA formyltransferase n=1 Tax=Taibaiella helva TaxID=2301235 RepID=UPI000E56B7DD|nr:formyltransferase family protein [Taibaiella helva]
MKLLILCNDRLALPALSQLLQQGKVAGVGMPARESEVQQVVKMMCLQHHTPLRLFTKASFKEELDSWLSAEEPDAVLVKTFPWKITAAALNRPRFGFINFHYAPLPAYRGANPLFWMIRDGAAATGVTVHRMTDEYDEGPVLLQSSLPIAPDATFGMIVAGLGFHGAQLADTLVRALPAGNIKESAQDSSLAKWYRRPGPQELWIDWKHMDAPAVKRLINACNPWNKGAPARLNGWTLGLSYATVLPSGNGQAAVPGTIICIEEEKGLQIACKDNTILRADVIYTEEGFLPGFVLAGWGIRPGMQFS